MRRRIHPQSLRFVRLADFVQALPFLLFIDTSVNEKWAHRKETHIQRAGQHQCLRTSTEIDVLRTPKWYRSKTRNRTLGGTQEATRDRHATKNEAKSKRSKTRRGIVGASVSRKDRRISCGPMYGSYVLRPDPEYSFLFSVTALIFAFGACLNTNSVFNDALVDT